MEPSHERRMANYAHSTHPEIINGKRVLEDRKNRMVEIIADAITEAVSTGQQSPSPATHGLRYPVFLREAMDEIRAIGKKYLVSVKEWQDQENLLRAERALALAKGYCDAMGMLAEAMADDCDVIEDCPNCTIGFAVKWDDGTNECPHCAMRWNPNAQN